MNTTGFSDDQKHALVDLLIVGMYADGNLASDEDACLQHLLESFQLPSDYDRQKLLDASFTRVNHLAGTASGVRAYIGQLAARFPTTDLKRKAVDDLEEILKSDDRFTGEELNLLAVVKEIFGV